MKKNNLWCILVLVAAFMALPNWAYAQIVNGEVVDHKPFKKHVVFLVCNDNGRNGYYEQKSIAEMMGHIAEQIGVDFVVAPGDIHHFNGVRSVLDPLWKSNFEDIYTHPELMCEWYPCLGNHEYRGSTQAVLDYATVSRRWCMPARYYTKTFKLHGAELRILWLDTTPLITKYREKADQYPDACKQPIAPQIQWADSVLTHSTTKWNIAFGHHPLYAQTHKAIAEQMDLRKRLLPIFNGRVDMYGCGHIHSGQYIVHKGTKEPVYLVNTSASLARDVQPIEGTQYCSNEAGFSIVTVSSDHIVVYMMNGRGNILHSFEIKK